MAKYISNSQRNLKLGISSYTENTTVLEVIGNVGIGTTNATANLDTGDIRVRGSLTSSSVNTTGISTLGLVKISTGIITATSGIVTYYGDGQYLQNIVSDGSIGIQSAGSLIGTASTINFTDLSVSVSNDIASVSVGSSIRFVGARMYHDNYSVTASGGWTAVTNFDGTPIDTNSFSNTTNGRFTIPAGVSKVKISTGIKVVANGNTNNQWTIYKNGSQIAIIDGGFNIDIDGTSGYSNPGTFGQTAIISVVEGDYFNLRYYVSNTALDVDLWYQIEVVEGSLLGHYFASTNVTNADNITVQANNSTNEIVYPVFVDGATGVQGPETDTGLMYNPSTGILSTTTFSGNLNIEDTGKILSDTFSIRNAGDSLNKMFFGNSGAGHIVRLYANGNERFTTTANGIFVQNEVITTNIKSSGISTFSNVNFDDQITYTASTNIMKFGDTASLRFGDGDDLSIYHTGGDIGISYNSNGLLFLRSNNNFQIDKNGSKRLYAHSGGAVDLYYANNKRLETTNDGINVTGIITANSFYGDGSNLTGVGGGSIAGINTTGTSHFNQILATNIKSSGISTFSNVNFDDQITYTASTNIMKFGDAAGLRFGDGDDLSIYHTGGDIGISYNSNGLLFLRSNNNFQIDKNGSKRLYAHSGGAVDLYYANNKRLETTNDGINVTGIITATSFSGSAVGLTSLTDVSSGTYGDTSNVAQIVVDANGRITGISEVAISGGGGGSGPDPVIMGMIF